MKAIIVCAAMLAAFCSSAEAAGLRDRCAASTGARSGAAFEACVSAGVAGGEDNGNPTKALYTSPTTRGKCRMTGNC